MIVRELHDGDVAEIRQWPVYPGDMLPLDYALRPQGWLDSLRNQPGVTTLAAVVDNELIGFTLLMRTGAAAAEFRIALRADKTGQGWGKTIAALTLQREWTALGLSRVHLIVRKKNNRAIRLYQRLGFTVCGECRRAVQGVLVDSLEMSIDCRQFAHNLEYQKEHFMAHSQHRALIVIDVQNEYIGGNLPIEYPPVEQSLANIGRAMDGAKAAGCPVVVVQNVLPEEMPILARGTHGAALHSSISERGWDHFVLKNLPSAFVGTGLEEWLRTNAIDTVTVAGYMTHNCVFSTIAQAMQTGFAVEMLSDATGALPYRNRAGSASAEEIHRVTSVVIQARFATVLTTSEWLDGLTTGVTPERDSIFSSNQRARQGDRG